MRRSLVLAGGLLLVSLAYSLSGPRSETPRQLASVPASSPSAPAPLTPPNQESSSAKAQSSALSHAARLAESAPTDLSGFAEKFARFDACQEGGCAYPEDDPHSYDFALNDDIARTLGGLTTFVEREKIEHSPQVSELARAHLESGNGFVQEAALKLIATQDPSPENLDAILEGILGGTDPDLIQAGLKELRRYPAPADHKKVDAALATAMTTGEPFIAEQVSLQISPFINDTNLSHYRGVAEQLPLASIYRGNLEAAIAQFGRSGSN